MTMAMAAGFHTIMFLTGLHRISGRLSEWSGLIQDSLECRSGRRTGRGAKRLRDEETERLRDEETEGLKGRCTQFPWGEDLVTGGMIW